MSLFDTKTNAFYRKFPNWVFVVFIIILFAGFVLSLYWGVTGIFKGRLVSNLLGIGCSLLGLGIYAFFFVMEMKKGKESPGQFDHDLSKIETSQQKALYHLIEQTNTKPSEVQIVPYWGMHKNIGNFVICIQKGNIIALQVKNKPVNDVADIASLKQLSWLVIENCGLKSIEGMNLPLLQRLAVNSNQLASLSGLENSPQIAWLNFRDNPIKDSLALKQLPNQHLYIINE
jgi:hypothetical protein